MTSKKKARPDMGKETARPAGTHWLWPAAVLTGLIAVIMALSLQPTPAGAEKEAAEPAKRPAMPVEAMPVKIAPLTRAVSAVGTLQADESATICSEIAGRVSRILFTEGERVKAGEVLLRLDDSVLRAQLDRAEADLGLSRANFKRAETLLKDRAISERERDEAFARWQLDEASLRLARANLDKTVIRAPFAGRLGLRNVSPGSYLRPGDDVVTLHAVDPIKVDFRVPEGFARQVRVGQTVQVSVDATPGRTYPGEVIAVAPQLDAEGRSMLLRARLANEKKMLNPGMFARISLALEERAEALVVPEESLVARGKEQMLYKVVDGKVEVSPVKTGIRKKGFVEIVEGARAGETVITAGHLKVRPGMSVTVLPATAATGDRMPAREG